MTSCPGMVRPFLETSVGQSCLASIACLLVGGAWWWFSHPVFALAVGLAPFAILAALRQPFLMVLGFLIFSFFRIHEVFPALYPLHIPQFLAFATLGALAWNLFTRRIEMFWSRELTAFAIFFMLVSIGVALATNRAEALDGYTGTFIKIAVMTVAMSWLVTGHKEFRLAARFIVLAGITVGLVAIYNQITGIGLIEGTRVTIGRDIGSMLGDPNDLALVLLFPASFTLALMLSPGIRWYEKLFGTASFVIILMAIIATQSRGGLLGIAAVIGVFAYRRIRSKTLLVIIGVAALAALFIIAGISGRESGGAGEEGIDESAMGRLYAWEAAFSMALANPLNPIPFNMREYLDTADKSLMPELNKGDTIFVPQVTDQIQGGSRTVYVMGEVFKPGAYETKDDASFFDVLATAGGPTRFAETRQIRILHADGNVTPFDLSAYTEGNKGISPPTILPGDAILVPEKVDMNEKSWLEVAPQRAIRIIGAVNRPGRYEWSGEMSVMDLIAHAGGPRAEADTAHVQVLSADADGSVAAIEVDLTRFLEKGGDLASLPSLKAGDPLVGPELTRVPNDNRSQWVRQSSERSIHIFGQVGAPGRYAFNEDLNFLDILSAAQGPTANADLRNVRITHRGEVGARTTHLNLALYFETGDESMLPKVRSEDVIYIPERNRAWLENSKETTVRVLGAVGKPGRYKFDDSMTILDLLAEAGGPTDLAVLDNITVVNITKEEPRARSFDLVAFAKSGDFTTLPVLRNGDTVFVASINQSDWKIFSEGISSAVSILSLVLLVTGL